MINRYVVDHLLIDDLELRKKKIAIADDGCTLMVSVSGYCKGKLTFYFHEQNKQTLFKIIPFSHLFHSFYWQLEKKAEKNIIKSKKNK